MLLALRDDNIQALPYILLQLAHIDPFRPFCVVHELRAYPPCEALRRCKQDLLPGLDSGASRTLGAVEDIVETASFVEVVVEELGVEGYTTVACS